MPTGGVVRRDAFYSSLFLFPFFFTAFFFESPLINVCSFCVQTVPTPHCIFPRVSLGRRSSLGRPVNLSLSTTKQCCQTRLARGASQLPPTHRPLGLCSPAFCMPSNVWRCQPHVNVSPRHDVAIAGVLCRRLNASAIDRIRLKMERLQDRQIYSRQQRAAAAAPSPHSITVLYHF